MKKFTIRYYDTATGDSIHSVSVYAQNFEALTVLRLLFSGPKEDLIDITEEN